MDLRHYRAAANAVSAGQLSVLSAVEHRLISLKDVEHDAKIRFAEIIAAVRSEVLDEDQCVERALYGAQGQ